MQSTTFYNELDFIQKLNHYISTEHPLTSTTTFCTMKITNFHTLDDHKSMIDSVTYFVQNNVGGNRLHDISVMTIKNLLQLFLYNNIFYYKNKIYTLTKGGPNTMPLSDTLSNIYLFVWQKKILNKVKQNRDEFFGR